MARYSFGVFGQGSGDLQPDLDITIKDFGTSTVKATTGTPSAGEIQIVDNGDGTYFVDDLTTGRYDIYVSGALQDEMTEQMVINEDVSEHIVNTTKHRLIDDTAGNGATTKLWSADKITDYTTAQFEPLNANLLEQSHIDGSSLQFSANAVSIKASGVATSMIQADAIDATKIADNSIGIEHMTNNSVNSAEIVAGAIDTAHIGAEQITESLVASNSIGVDKIKHGSDWGLLTFGSDGSPSISKLTTSQVEDDCITTSKIDDLMVTRAKIDLKAVDTAQLENEAVSPAKIKDHSGYGTLIFSSDGTPSYGKITGNCVDSNTLTAEHFTAGIMDETALVTATVGSDASTRGASESGLLGSLLTVAGVDDKFAWNNIFFSSDFKLTEADTASSMSTQIAFNSNFTSNNYLSNSKDLNQNMDILDQRLGYLTQFSGTEGLYVELAGADWNFRTDGAGTPLYATSVYDAFITDNSSSDQNDATDYVVYRKQFYKVPDMRQLALYVRSRVSSNVSDFSGQFNIKCSGQNISEMAQASDLITTTTVGDTITAVYLDLTGLGNYELYNTTFSIRFENGTGSSNKTYNVQDWCMVVKRQITVVDGSTSNYENNPL